MSADSAPRVAIAGCAGRMGRTLLTAAHLAPDCELIGGFEHAASPLVGKKLAHISRLDDERLEVEPSVEPLLPQTDIVTQDEDDDKH